MTKGHCKACGKKLKDPNATHCSDKCLFTILGDSVSIYGKSILDQDKEDPCV